MAKKVAKAAKKLSDKPPPYQAVNWAFTLHDWTPDEDAAFRALVSPSIVALQYGKEICPDTNRPHLQGVVVVPKKLTRGSLQKLLLPSRPKSLSCKPCYASVAANKAYTAKDGDVYTYGDFDLANEDGKMDANARAAVLLELAEKGDWDTLRKDHPAAYLYNKRQLLQAQSDALYRRGLVPDVLNGVLDNYWIYGAAGEGKDKYAISKMVAPYQKNGNTKWWDGYMGEKDVWLRDLGHSAMPLLDDLKNWTDRYKFPGEVKFGALVIRPTRIFVTSNYHPRDLRGMDADNLAAVERRFQLVHAVKGTARMYPRVNTVDAPLLVEVPWTEELDEPI